MPSAATDPPLPPASETAPPAGDDKDSSQVNAEFPPPLFRPVQPLSCTARARDDNHCMCSMFLSDCARAAPSAK